MVQSQLLVIAALAGVILSALWCAFSAHRNLPATGPATGPGT
ncbi:MAG TPA: hypothetical protein VGH53_24655 [Streptosporangiaceae bacterium]|jgi:hypothetical protein